MMIKASTNVSSDGHHVKNRYNPVDINWEPSSRSKHGKIMYASDKVSLGIEKLYLWSR